MAFGQIYCTTDFGDASNKQTIPHFPDCSGFKNEFSMYFDGATPGESIHTLDLPYQVLENTGMVIYSWLEPNTFLDSGTFAQKCVVDYSSDIFSTANGKGYSIFFRRTSTQFTINWFYKRTGLTRSQCSVFLNLSSLGYVMNKPMLIVATLIPNASGQDTVQSLRVYQDGVSGAGPGYAETSKTVQVLGTSFPQSQNLCFGNTNDSGTVSSEFIGNLDDTSIFVGSNSNVHLTDWETHSEVYWEGRNDVNKLNLSNYPLPNFNFQGWFRMGDGATYNGSFWEFPNASGSGTAGAESDTSMTPTDRQSSII